MVKQLALTFDDGPDENWTPRLLDLLAEADATATFFPIAPRAQKHPALIRRMLAGGHTVGLHCDEHIRHTARTAQWGWADTERGLWRLYRVGFRPTLWRTPWGVTSGWTASVAAEHQLRLVGWTVDTHDWRGDSATAMFKATRDSLNADAIVLAHDGIGPGARRTDVAETVAYVELAIEYARDRGLALRALGAEGTLD
ncbi:MAG TPA: polysaccharide deacetylase family protein [Solirubrobacteraceae bacterium]|jgi:peptidoglycan/xylan/chitin deacetylase (PgdA/CDA1 family)